MEQSSASNAYKAVLKIWNQDTTQKSKAPDTKKHWVIFILFLQCDGVEKKNR